MTSKVLLNNADHLDLRVAVRHSAEFGDCVNQMLIFPTEFAEVQREFSIFFRKDEAGAFQAVALLGLDRDDNLFFSSGAWQTRYIPAIQRRGPFSIALQQQPAAAGVTPMIHIDLGDPRVGVEDGHRLFLAHGGHAPYLEQVMHVLDRIYTGMTFARRIYPAWEEEGLLEPIALEIGVDDGFTYTLPDFHAVSEEKLAALDGAALARLHRAGFLAPAFLAAASIANVDRLIELKRRRERAG